jgi:hypothetical protein
MSAESYRKLRANAKLVKETEWMRVYELGPPKSFTYESKFLTDKLQISAESFATRWPTMTPAERLDFTQAYCAKAEFTSDDERIVNLIMNDGDVAGAKGEGVLVCTHGLNFHFVGECAFGRVHLPFAHEGIVRCPYRAHNQTSNQQQPKGTH